MILKPVIGKIDGFSQITSQKKIYIFYIQALLLSCSTVAKLTLALFTFVIRCFGLYQQVYSCQVLETGCVSCRNLNRHVTKERKGGIVSPIHFSIPIESKLKDETFSKLNLSTITR